MIKNLSLFSFLILYSSLTFADSGLPLIDDFSKPDLATRSLARGEWKIVGSLVQCTQDDELYKKHNAHGPMITYKISFNDAAMKYSFKPDAKVKNVVFTINNENGHVFRIVASAEASRAFTFDADHKNQQVAKDLPSFRIDQWNDVLVEVRGKQLKIKMGDYEKSFASENVAVPKESVTLGFSFGSLAVRDIRIEP
jgi:hypothetical protein